MQWQLVVGQGHRKGQIIPVRRNSFLIGRDPICHLRPAADSVSRQHCVLTIRDARLFIADCQSSNGTFVNDRRL
jgi:pSer/pThr/pTyr-binding forkhead associated (FHA) protein